MIEIIDCFIFYNEIELLLYRLTILDMYVKYFVIVEATHTFAGHPKTSVYLENIHLFDKFKHKIIHKIINMTFVYPHISYAKKEQWENEYHQRNAMKNCVVQLYETNMIENNSNIIISDVDEIVDPCILKSIINNEIIINDGLILPMNMYYYNLTRKHEVQWTHVKIVTFTELLSKTCNDIRCCNIYKTHEKTCGWHLSYFGNPEFIKNKLAQFSHQEYNNSNYTDFKKITQRVATGVDLFDRSSVNIKYVCINNNTYLPPQYETYLSKYC